METAAQWHKGRDATSPALSMRASNLHSQGGFAPEDSAAQAHTLLQQLSDAVSHNHTKDVR